MEKSPETWIGAGGARGGAKSGGLRRIILLRAATYPKTRHLILRRKRKQLVDNHITPLFREYPILESMMGKVENTLHLPNASDVVFGYAENPAHDLQGDIYDFQGSEWLTIGVDEAGQMNEEELTFIKTCCRWPGMNAKMILTMNPGGRGHNFLKRIFVDRRFDVNEKPEDYAFIRAYGWDNVEWVRGWLDSQGITDHDYYDKFTEAERQSCFLDHSDYGRVLAALKGKMRSAYLLGDWDAFAGQFFDIWNEEEAVQVCPKIEEWWPKWISIDWGYEHNSAVYWHTQDGNRTHTFQELCGQHISPHELGDRIVQMSEGLKISDVYLSPDAFELSRRKWISQDTIAMQLGSRLRAGGLPEPCRADHDRIGGWRLMHQLLSAGLWTIDPSCKRLIECIPNLQRDEEKREDVMKCLAVGTLIETRAGAKPIENITAGDEVLTSQGFCRVRKAWKTGYERVWKLMAGRAYMVGTAEHPVLTARGWIPLTKVDCDDILCSCLEKPSLSTALTFIGTEIGGTSSRILQLVVRELRAFTAKCGNFITALFPPLATFTTSTGMEDTTTFPTWNVFLRAYTTADTVGRIPRQQLSEQSGDGNSERQLLGAVSSVQVPSNPGRCDHSIVPSSARVERDEIGRAFANLLVRTVARLSFIVRSITHGFVPKYVSTVEAVGRSDVYNLTVDSCHEFFANGILTHNCDCDETGAGGDDPADSARYGLKSRLTTPRPPTSVRIAQRIDSYAKEHGTSMEEMDPTALAMLARKAQRIESPRKRLRFRPGRAYTGAPAGRM